MGNKQSYQIPGQLSLYDLEILLPMEKQSTEDLLENLRHKDVKGYRVKTVKAGRMLECEIYPIYARNEAGRARNTVPSRQAQENLNHRNTRKYIVRLTNHNFTDADQWTTLGYDDDKLPPDISTAKKDLMNFLRRIKRKMKKRGLPDLKFLYVTEFCNDGKRIRCHHHVIMSGGLSRDEVENTWHGGAYPQTRRLRVREDCGLTGLASYLAKGKRYERRWGHSRNLKPPIITTADHKITRRQVERMIIDENEIPAIMERKCKGYLFRGIEIKRSEFVAGAYVYIQMYRRC